MSLPGPRIFLAGGSNMTTREQSVAPMTGWGQVLHHFLRPEVQVVNCARAGASARTFAERGRLGWILDHLRPGDYVLTSFGTNDAKTETWLRSEAFGTFDAYLLRYVDGARERNAHPVLISTHERNTYDVHGNLPRSITEYPMSMREVARRTCTPYINLNEQSHGWWAELGPERIRKLFLYLAPGEHPNYAEGFEDPGHFVPAGAMACARYVAYALAAQRIVPQDWVVNLDGPDLPPEAAEWLDEAHHAALTKARTLGTGGKKR